MIIIDGGSCIGSTIDYFLNNYKPTKIYGFEPVPNNFKVLQDKYKDNKIIILEECALNNVSGTMPLYIGAKTQEKDIVGGTLCEDKYKVKNRTELCIVRTIKLSDYWKSNINENVGLLKLNVEGAEFDIFEDLLDAGIINKFEAITFENHALRSCERLIPSIQKKSKLIMERMKKEYTGTLTLMPNGRLTFSSYPW